MSKIKMKHLIVLIPGIMGSILRSRNSQQNGWDIENIAFAALTGNDNLERLRIQGSDDDEDEFEATELIKIPDIIGGLIKTASYKRLSKFITDQFDVTPGRMFNDQRRRLDDQHLQDQSANFFEFPYDWRRDNRISARRLQHLINLCLPKWRDKSENPEAKVIIIAHSMGGLVARYYLEVLEGWRNCRGLITLGTPYQGAVDAVDYLANGHRIGFANLTNVVRSFTSVHQLMSTYPMVRNGDQYNRVQDILNIDSILNTNSDKLQRAWSFHQEIKDAIKSNQTNIEYLSARNQNKYEIIAFVGKGQNTSPSLDLVNNTEIRKSQELPLIEIDNQLIDTELTQELVKGDGTVPRLSATPPELGLAMSGRSYFAEKHSCLQVNSGILDALRELLRDGAIRGEVLSTNQQPAMISLELEDVYVSGEPVEIYATLSNLQSGTDIGNLQATITSVENDQQPLTLNFQQQTEEDSSWVLTTEQLRTGLYHLKVSSSNRNSFCPTPIQDIFAVV